MDDINSPLSANGFNELVHELVHVWQYQNADPGLDPAYAIHSLVEQQQSGKAAYDWTISFNKKLPWEQWGIEHQAQAIQDYDKAIRRVSAARWNKLKPASEDVKLVKELAKVGIPLKLRFKIGAPSFQKYDDLVQKTLEKWR